LIFFLKKKKKKKKKMKISEIVKLLTRLSSYDRDIESWAEEFNRVMELSDIDDPRKMLDWAKERVLGWLKGVIEDLKEEDVEAEMIIYPSITDIKTVIEKFLDITPQEKCFNLKKSLKIQKDESIKDFNWRYGKLYGSLTPESQAFITIIIALIVIIVTIIVIIKIVVIVI